MNLISGFKNYLLSQKNPSSKLTVKNYICDLRKFITWFETTFHTLFSPSMVTLETIELFRKENSNLSTRSLDRSASTFRKFFNFLMLEGYISESPFKQLNNQAIEQSDPWKLKAFKDYLYVYNASDLTIKNYLADIKSFLNWVENVAVSDSEWDIKEKNLFNKINEELIEEYKERIKPTNKAGFSPATVNRKLSSLRKYLTWAREKGYINAESQISNLKSQKYSSKLKSSYTLNASKLDAPKGYSSFPPFRFVQKTKQGIGILLETVFISPLASLIKAIELLKWRIRGRPVFISKIQDTKYKILNLRKDFYAPLLISTKSFPFYKKLLFSLRHNRPKWYKTYHSYALSHYLHFAILVMIMSAIGFGLYQNLNEKPLNRGVLGIDNPKSPSRIFSFQGKLTDNSGNPITSSTSLRFGIYNSITGTGSALMWQEVDTVTPDSEGIFSALLGTVSTMQQSMFAEHQGLWLGVSVGKTAELTPRQQLATVAFAQNSDTLEGLPPITNVDAGTKNVVLALDSSGNLTIGGTATPTFQATGGQLTLSGNILLLTTLAGSKSDIIASPSGLGKIDLNKPIRNTSDNNNVSSAVGAVEVDDTLAVLATSSAQSAFTINQNGSGSLISASTSDVAKFTIGNSGDLTLAGGNFSQTGSTTFSTGTGTVSLNGATTAGSTLGVTGTTSLNGAVNLGDATADDIAVNGRLTTSFVPKTTANVDLGTTALRFNNLWTQTINTTGTNTSGQASFTQNPATTAIADASVLINPTTVTNAGSALLGIAVAGVEKARIDETGKLTLQGAIVAPTSTNTINSLVINAGALSGITTQSMSGQLTSTLANGTAPFVVASTTNVANLNASSLNGATFAAPGPIGSGTPSTGAFTTLSASSTLTASNGLTLTTGALSLTGTSGSIALTGFGTTSITSTTASGNILNLADASFTTTGANLADLTFTNTNSGAGAVTTNGVSITPTGTTITGGGTNTLNAINLPTVTPIASNTFNGINFGTGYNNLINSANFTVAATGAVVGVGIDSGSGLLQGTGGETVTGTTNINATGTSATNIGNSALTGVLTLASGGTSGWTNTSGNLTLSTATSGTLALTSAGALNLSAASASTVTLASSSTTALNFQSGLLDLDTTNSRVGIGTTSPQTTLQVGDFASTTFDSTLTSYGNFALRASNSILAFGLSNSSPYGQWIQSHSVAGGALALLLNPSGGNVGIGTTNPGGPLDVKSTITGGTLTQMGAPSAVTLATALTGQKIDLNTNYTTANGLDVTGSSLLLPALTQTSAGTSTYIGYNLGTAGALAQNTLAGTINWTGLNVQMPNITQTTGTVTSTGLAITGGTVTSGTAYALTTTASAGNVGIGTTAPGAQLQVNSQLATTIGTIIKGQTSQSADLLQLQNSVAAVLAKVDYLGNLTANTLTSSVAQGTAPLTVTSNTVVANLNAAAAQQPLPNLVLNSDFGRRNKWITFMPETFTDTNGAAPKGWTVQAGSIGTVDGAGTLTAGTSGGTTWRILGGLSTWRDARFSAQWKAVDNPAGGALQGGVGRWQDSSNYIKVMFSANILYLQRVTAGSGTYVATTPYTATTNNWYWTELEMQGSMAIAKLYSSGASAVAKSSATLVATMSFDLGAGGGGTSGQMFLEAGTTAASVWGGLSSGDGGVYVEGWGPESWGDDFLWTTKGGQAFGYDETADVGPTGQQYVLRYTIPEATRHFYTGTVKVPVKPSTAYTLSWYEKTLNKSGSDPLATLLVNEYNSAGTNTTGDTNANWVDAGETGWTHKSASFTTGSTAVTVRVYIMGNYLQNSSPASASTGTAFITGLQLEQGSIMTPWRNAPSDDGPIVWNLPVNTANLTTTSGTDVEVNPRDWGVNAFLPWDAEISMSVFGTWGNSLSGQANVAGGEIDGSLINGNESVYENVASTNTFPYGFVVGSTATQGKHRASVVYRVSGGNTLTLYNAPATQVRFIATKGKHDLAEEYSVLDPTIEAGDVVQLASNNSQITSNTTIERSNQGYSSSVLGIVSTAPAVTLGKEVYLNSYQQGSNLRPVALSGRVPVKVTNENGPIKRGDILTSSEKYAGYAMKATKAGKSIGVAMDDFILDSTIGNVQFGTIMTFINLSWYDPDVYLTDTGNFVINKTQNIAASTNQVLGTVDASSSARLSTLQASPVASCEPKIDPSNFGLVTTCPESNLLTYIQNSQAAKYAYQITDSAGNVIQKVGVFSQSVIGSLRVGAINAKDIIADNLIIDNKIVSPIAEVNIVRTNVITPLGEDKIVIRPNETSASASAVVKPILEIQNASGSAVATIDTAGNVYTEGNLTARSATFSGQLKTKEVYTDNLSAGSATVSGTLKAKNIIADNIDTQILNLKTQLSNLMPTEASSSAQLGLQLSASESTVLAKVDTLQAEVGTFNQGLFVIGTSSFSNATVFGQLSIGATLILADNSINVLGTDLKLQPLGQGGILLGKKVYIDANGDLSVGGNATVKGTLFAGLISPIPGNDLIINLLNKNATESSKFVIKNASGSAVASIDSQGNAMFKKLNLSIISPAFALSEREVLATGSAGVATISARQKELTIDNKLVTDKSLIYVSPVGTPSAQVPFLLRQTGGTSFTVGTQDINSNELPFNWLIIN